MSNYIIYSIVTSVILTVVLYILPLLFPNAATKVQKKIDKNARQTIEQHEDDNRPRVKMFFPWKVILIASIVLTVLVNLIGSLAR